MNIPNFTRFKSYKNDIILNHHKDHIGKCISITNKFYEIEMLDYIKQNIPKGGTYVDVGANIGNHSVYFAKFCADKVVSIEPIPNNWALIEKNMVDNNLENYVLHKYGLSKDGRSFDFTIIPHNMGMCNLIDNGNKIKSITPDDLNLEDLKVLKIDCELMSMEVLKAFVPLIKKYKPHVFIEATTGELEEIQKMTGYVVKGKFNATPTYHLFKKQVLI